jgi:anti-sigma factor RsiW
MKRHNQCETAHEQMLDALAPEAQLPEALAAHLKQCSACASELETMRKTWQAMDAWTAPEPSPYFDSRLQARLREEKMNPQPRGIFAWLGVRWQPALAATLALALVIVIGAMRIGGWNSGAGNSMAANQPSAVADLQNLDKNADVYTDFDMLYDDGDQQQVQQ